MRGIASLAQTSAGRNSELRPLRLCEVSLDKEDQWLHMDNEESEQQQSASEPTAETPWPTNGGPLGCLIGLLAGLLLGAFLGTTLFAFDRLIGIPLTMVFAVALAIVGWKIGRRIFREYKPPKPRRRPSKG